MIHQSVQVLETSFSFVILEMVLPQTQQDAGGIGSGFLVSRVEQVTDEKQLFPVRGEEIGHAQDLAIPALGGGDIPLLYTRPPVDVTVMLADLTLQLLVGRFYVAESGEVAVPGLRLAHEKGVAVVADGRQDIQLVVIPCLGHLLKRSAK